ncbi:MAG: hypothetical protein COB22_03780 [Cycloclasticus sp.]|nr:MAG: hypothetical protein COB22_03780 [Cycloclasticus sp.]
MKPLKEKHKQYTVDFKLTAIRLAEHPNVQTQDVAIALGIHPFMLSRWKKEHRDGQFEGAVHECIKGTEEKVLEHKQIRELEKRINKLELENVLLKKSMSHGFEPN